eukprot:Sspe_Gene.27557::Locus_11945_Transcript_3_3_Confidence_0.750_Length_463::g.27557::m.27557
MKTTGGDAGKLAGKRPLADLWLLPNERSKTAIVGHHTTITINTGNPQQLATPLSPKYSGVGVHQTLRCHQGPIKAASEEDGKTRGENPHRLRTTAGRQAVQGEIVIPHHPLGSPTIIPAFRSPIHRILFSR